MFEGQSKDERFDSNDHLIVTLPIGKPVQLEISHGDASQSTELVPQRDGQVVTLRMK